MLIWKDHSSVCCQWAELSCSCKCRHFRRRWLRQLFEILYIFHLSHTQPLELLVELASPFVHKWLVGLLWSDWNLKRVSERGLTPVKLELVIITHLGARRVIQSGSVYTLVRWLRARFRPLLWVICLGLDLFFQGSVSDGVLDVSEQISVFVRWRCKVSGVIVGNAKGCVDTPSNQPALVVHAGWGAIIPAAYIVDRLSPFITSLN